jgi:tetratricopeptide (TPR) repeat protein
MRRLSHASGDWIFWLDGDEYVDCENLQKLHNIFTSLDDDNVAFVMTQRSLYPHRLATVHTPHVRLFRNHSSVCWEYRVHEQPFQSLRRAGYDIRSTNVVITHTGYQDSDTYTLKLKRNLHLLHLDQFDYPDDPVILYNLGITYLHLELFNEALSSFQRILQLFQPGDANVPVIYAPLIHLYCRMGQFSQALATCREGREHFPHNPQLLFIDGQLQRAKGNLSGAELCWRQVLVVRFASSSLYAAKGCPV